MYFFSLLDWSSSAVLDGVCFFFFSEGEVLAFLGEGMSFLFSVLTFLLAVDGDVDEGEGSRFLDGRDEVRALLRGVSGSAFILTSSSLIVGVSSFFATPLAPPRLDRRVGVALVDSLFVFVVDARAAARFTAAAISSGCSIQKTTFYGDAH